jgi:lysozyme
MPMSDLNRRPIFAATKALIVKATNRDYRFTPEDVQFLDKAIDEALGQIVVVAPSVPGQRKVSPAGIALMHSFEGCRLEAYPDPGSRDGNPWTIGWGSTGPGIHKGVKWTQAQADERFAKDLNDKYGAEVNKILGDTPTTQSQFDALVSLAYNIGSRKLAKSTVMRRHKAKDYKGAAQAFLMWNKNDGKVMRGLTRRRLAEADLYDNDG